MENILKVNNLKVEFGTGKRKLVAVNDLTFYVKKKEILGLVGESGSGKTMTALSILNLVPFPGRISSGKIIYKDKEITNLNEKEMAQIRGKEISVIFQDPHSSLNPSYRIGWQIFEIVKYNLDKKYRREILLEKIINILKRVGIPNPEQKINQYPHQLSGGMRQRVIISMALLLNSELIIADEPTTALDVTIQKEIFDLLEDVKEKENISIFVISHDIYLMTERCDRILVMYAGQIIEEGKPEDIFYHPMHPYTKGLLKSIPKLDERDKRLETIKGEVLSLFNLSEIGCPFYERCDYRSEVCITVKPELNSIDGRSIRCHLYG